MSFIRNGVGRYDVVGVEWCRHSAPSTKRQCLCLDKLLIHSRATNGVLAVARGTKFAAVDIRATSLRIGAVARRMMERRVARRNHFSSRPSIIIGGVSGREVGRQSLKCEWLYPDERTKRVHASFTKGFPSWKIWLSRKCDLHVTEDMYFCRR